MAPSIAAPRIVAQNPRASAAGSARIRHPRAARFSRPRARPRRAGARTSRARGARGPIAYERATSPRQREGEPATRPRCPRSRARRCAGCACGLPRVRPRCRPQHAAARRLDVERLLAAEVVRDLARERAGRARDLGGGHRAQPAVPEQPAGRVEQRPPCLPAAARVARGYACGLRDRVSYKQRSQGGLHHRDRFGSPPRRGGNPDRCPRPALGL